MRFIVRFFKGIGNFLDHRFPERMTVEDVRKENKFYADANARMFLDFEKRILTLEDQHNKMLAKITSLQVLSGIRGAMAERE
jgi:hypothetical protein